LWTVTNFIIRESRELSGNQSGHIPEKLESQFRAGFCFCRECGFSVRPKADLSPLALSVDADGRQVTE